MQAERPAPRKKDKKEKKDKKDKKDKKESVATPLFDTVKVHKFTEILLMFENPP